MKSFVLVGRSVLLAMAMFVSAALPAVVAQQAPASAATQATYYVAPSGNDSNPGTITAPFRTLQRARTPSAR